MSTQLKFRYNGDELAVMKKLAGTTDPHKAVEDFIAKSIEVGMNPQDRLKIAMLNTEEVSSDQG